MAEYVIETKGNATEELAGSSLEGKIADANKKLVSAKVEELSTPVSMIYTGIAKGVVEGLESESTFKSNDGWDKILSLVEKCDGMSVVDYQIKCVYELSREQSDAMYGTKRSPPAFKESRSGSYSEKLFR